MKAVHCAEHRRMRELASTILAVASGRRPSESGELAQLRLSFARLVNAHCNEEGRTIREAIRAGLVCATTAATFQRELQRWRAALASLNSDWPGSRADRDPRGFASAFKSLADDLGRYIELEESQILDKIPDVS
ncbi:hemerythrin domain-containing protein [Sphingomonas sp. LR60]|uniref:hemerythrin domain-containing protein n=1 Tax=Sphingomonas sp. LR60 TaxID=3050233 RepID=UPI002FE3266D